MQGLISFIIPVKNRDEERIKNCVNSLRGNNTGEIIIVDYGSEPRISNIEGTKLIRYNKNKIWNKAHAINLGIRAAKYDYIGTVDCDMIISKDFMDRAKEHISENSFIYSINVRRVNQEDVSDSFKDMLSKSFLWNNSIGRYSIIHNANGGIQIYPKRWITRIGGVDECLIYWGGMDNDVFERAIINGLITVNINAPLLHQEHELKKEANLSGTEKIIAVKIKIEKSKYLEEVFRDRKYIRNDGCWGMDKPNQKRFLKTQEEQKKAEIKEKKELERYNKALMRAASAGKKFFIFKGEKTFIFNNKEKKKLEKIQKLPNKKAPIEIKNITKEDKSVRNRNLKEIKRLAKEKRLAEKKKNKYNKAFINAVKKGKKSFIFEGKKVELFHG